jgi:RNA polymerase sigma-70 factor (ECF subfamily)
LYGIATREIGKHRRTEDRRRRALQREWAGGDSGEFADGALDRVTAERLRPRLAGALAALSPPERDLLLLIAWADLSYAEAAEALGIPVGTARSRLHRLRAKFRRSLGGADLMDGDKESDDG